MIVCVCMRRRLHPPLGACVVTVHAVHMPVCFLSLATLPSSLSVDGGWAEWTEWTVCSGECERQRNRECTAPEPKRGGRLCDGAALGTYNCTGGLCTHRRQSSLSCSSHQSPHTHSNTLINTHMLHTIPG
ncbi:unnamed protein product [Oncorhynchus mykiss]|uniref:Uncharacterized protein n=1 Tax=Oncorhynchus mykiss TaxID=8022 RepID=A0A060ZA21_ONCMY|nr:unnamed protein product [Oncorhynchus mykiss]